MSAVVDNQTDQQQGSLPDSVRGLLGRARYRVRRDLLLSGFTWVIAAAGILFWLTNLLDYGWFGLQRLELPLFLRVLIIVAALAVLAWGVITRCLLPGMRRPDDVELALLAERRWPQFGDVLLTTVEASRCTPATGRLVPHMLARVRDAASRLAATVSADDLFDTTPLRRGGMIAGGLLVSVLLAAVLVPGALERWWNAFVRVETHYVKRTTEVEVYAVVPPDDRRAEFRRSGDELLHLHAVGTDLQLDLVVPEGTRPDGGEWVVPERIRVDVTREDGTFSRTWITNPKERTFSYVMTRLRQEVTLELLAGDYRSPIPLRVRPVEVPVLRDVQLECEFPDYTGWNELRERSLPVLGSESELPPGTSFELSARATRPLTSARIVTDRFEWIGDRDGSRLIRRQSGVRAGEVGAPLLDKTGTRLAAEFVLDPAGPEAESGMGPVSDGQVALLPGETLQFYLEGEDGVRTQQPDQLKVRGIPDRAPLVNVQMQGIGNAISRRAVLPFSGSIQDDYGLVEAGFEFRVDDETNWRPRPFRKTDGAGRLQVNLGGDDGAEKFNAAALDLSEGQTLTLRVRAADGYPWPAGQEGLSEIFLFRVVSNEELLSLLYTREISLRRRLEEVIRQLETVRDDLEFHRELTERLSAAPTTITEDQASIATCAGRSANQVRRQLNELQAVVLDFQEIVAQLVNNAIPPQQLAESMRKEIVEPLDGIRTGSLRTADRAISGFRVDVQAGSYEAETVRRSATATDLAVSELKQVLEQVRDMAEFHEALRDLKAILEEQQRLLEETKSLQKKQLLDKLKLLD